MNMAIIIPTLGGGGAERVAKIIGDYYVGQGNRVYYFLEKTDIRQTYQVRGQVIHTGIRRSTAENIFGKPEILAKLVKASYKMRMLKRKYEIDVAISFMEECNYINILSKGREKVITRICTILSQDADWINFLYDKRMIRYFYPKADKVVVMSKYAVNDMHINFNLPLKKMVKIANPVLPPEKDDIDGEWKYGNRVIIAVGRLASEKQHDRIIKAFSYVYLNEPSSRLLILGMGPKENYLKKIRKEYQLENQVIFAGFKNNISYYLKKSRAFVMASSVEGFPNSLLEAMSNGLPVITTDTPGGCGEIVGKRNIEKMNDDIRYCSFGIITPYMSGPVQIDSHLTNEEYALARAMLNIVKDDSLHEKYSRRSLRRASMYSIKNIMPKWDKILF